MNTSFKSIFIYKFYKLSNYFATNDNKVIKIIGIPIRIFYKLIIEFIMSVEITDKLKIGKNLIVYHGMVLVINANAQIG